MHPTSAPAGGQRREAGQAPVTRLAELSPAAITRIVGFLDSARDLAAANATARLFRGAPVEAALRKRSLLRGHARALPAALPAAARTWTEELFAREAVHALACAHSQVAVAGRSYGSAARSSAFADAAGGVYTCGEEFYVARIGVAPQLRCPIPLGHSDPTDAPPVAVPRRVPSLGAVRVRALAAGDGHLLALSAAGAVYSCGMDDCGQLGVGDVGWARAFTPVVALAAVDCAVGIAAGYFHSLALGAGGCAYSWGDNQRGQLGHGDTEPRFAPKRVAAVEGVRLGGLAGGLAHTLLLGVAGEVYSCGEGRSGQLGHGSRAERRAPTRVAALAGVRAVHVSAGEEHSLVVDAEGRVHGFGDSGGSGRLGGVHAEHADRLTPKPIQALASVRAVCASAGNMASAVVGADGRAHTLGDSLRSQLGAVPVATGPEQSRATVPPIGHVVGVSLGENHALFVTADGGAYSLGGCSAALGHGLELSMAHGLSGVLGEPRRVAELPPLRRVRVAAAAAAAPAERAEGAPEGVAQ